MEGSAPPREPMPLSGPSAERAGTGRLPRAHASFQRGVRDEVSAGTQSCWVRAAKLAEGLFQGLAFPTAVEKAPKGASPLPR